MIARLVSFVVALSAMAAAAGVVIVSGAFALYALLRFYIGPSGSAACVTLAAAIVLGLCALVMFGRSKKPSAKSGKAGGGDGIVGRMSQILGERPIVAAGAAVAAGLLAWRNPALVSTLLRVVEARSGGGKQA